MPTIKHIEIVQILFKLPFYLKTDSSHLTVMLPHMVQKDRQFQKSPKKNYKFSFLGFWEKDGCAQFNMWNQGV